MQKRGDFWIVYLTFNPRMVNTRRSAWKTSSYGSVDKRQGHGGSDSYSAMSTQMSQISHRRIISQGANLSKQMKLQEEDFGG